MSYRQIDDLSLNDDPIRIPKIISMIIRLLYSGTDIRSFSNSQNCNENSHVLPVNCFKIVTRHFTTKSTFQEVVKPLTKGDKNGTNDLL